MTKADGLMTWRDIVIGSIVTEPGNSIEYLTGDWKSQRPIYFKDMETISPCEMYCPINQDIRKWLSLVQEEKLKEAWEAVLEKNPIPAVIGRICPHFCENNCNRKDFDEAVGTGSIEQFLGDEALKQKWSMPVPRQNGKKVAVIGSGPAGLSCAYQLGREGYKVTIYEEFPVIGGMLSVGIPEYRLSKSLLMQEIENNILPLGIEIEKNVRVDDAKLNELSHNFDAVFIATGAQQSIKMNIDGEDARGVISGLDMLKKINLGQTVELGKEVIVVGGGNTAIDAAHSALKLGAKVTIVYRRSRNEMPAIAGEVEEAEKDGVKLQTLANPVKIITKDGKVTGVECIKMELGEPDESGRARPVPIEGSNFTIEADMLISAIGENERADFSDAAGQNQKVFKAELAGYVATAIKVGVKAAKEIGIYLTEGKRVALEDEDNRKLVEFKDLNMVYFNPQARSSSITDSQSAVNEANRCFNCGTCTICGNCWLFCPDSSVMKVDGEFQFNYDYCKGCGICAEECPRGAIYIKEEE
jgi:2-oxoacid:acceptor oxidoreductase delta subunit (pyruvate/2-ketoisovalerate family)